MYKKIDVKVTFHIQNGCYLDFIMFMYIIIHTSLIIEIIWLILLSFVLPKDVLMFLVYLQYVYKITLLHFLLWNWFFFLLLKVTVMVTSSYFLSLTKKVFDKLFFWFYLYLLFHQFSILAIVWTFSQMFISLLLGIYFLSWIWDLFLNLIFVYTKFFTRVLRYEIWYFVLPY